MPLFQDLQPVFDGKLTASQIKKLKIFKMKRSAFHFSFIDYRIKCLSDIFQFLFYNSVFDKLYTIKPTSRLWFTDGIKHFAHKHCLIKSALSRRRFISMKRVRFSEIKFCKL